MSKKDNTTNKTVELKESFNGANKLSPSNPDTLSKRSFNGAQNIAPPAQDSEPLTTSDTTITEQPSTQSQTTDTGSSDKK